MREVSMYHNKIDQVTEPAIYNRGNYPINGIFASNYLDIVADGYLCFGDPPYNQCGLWIEISIDVAFSNNNPEIITTYSRNLQLIYPRKVKYFNCR